MDVRDPISNICAICELPFDQDEAIVTISRKKGKKSLKKVSELRKDGKFSYLDLENDLQDIITHVKCRKSYYMFRKTNDHGDTQNSVETPLEVALLVINENGEVSNSLLLQLDSNHEAPQFDYTNLCIFCAEDASDKFKWQQLRLIDKNLTANPVKQVGKQNYKQVLRHAMVWGEEVFERVIDKDLVSLDARFHADCFMLYAAANIDNKNQINYIKKIVDKLEKEIDNGSIEELTKAILQKDKVHNEQFNYEKHCIICATDTSDDASGGPIFQVYRVTTAVTLMKLVNLAAADVSTEEVRSRAENVDLVSLRARCHKVCYLQFYNSRCGAMDMASRAHAGLDIYKDYIVDDDREFSYLAHCLICGKEALNPEGAANDIRLVQRQHTGRHLLEVSLRFHDMWREQVRLRVQGKDLVSLGARYHKACFPQLFIPPPSGACAMETLLHEQNMYNDMYPDILPGEEAFYGVRQSVTVDSHPNAEMVKSFDLAVHCLICGDDASSEFVRRQLKKPLHKRVHVAIAQERGILSLLKLLERGDPRDLVVRARIEGYSLEELVALKVRYHALCKLRFLKLNASRKKGRPPGKDILNSLKDWSDFDHGNHTTEDQVDMRQDRTDIRQDRTDMRQDCSDIRQDRSDIRQDRSDIRQDNCDTNEDCHNFDDEHDKFEYKEDCKNTFFQDFSSSERSINAGPNSSQEFGLDVDGSVEIAAPRRPKRRRRSREMLNTAVKMKDTKFDFHNCCVLCGQDASQSFLKKQLKKPPNKKVHVSLVKESTIEILNNVMELEEHRRRFALKKRIGGFTKKELLSLGARYHKICLARLQSSNRKEVANNKAKSKSSGWRDFVDVSVKNHPTEDELDRSQDRPDITEGIDDEKDMSDHDWPGGSGEAGYGAQTLQEFSADDELPENKYYEMKICQASVNKSQRQLGNNSLWSGMVCNVCLSGDRALRGLGRYAHLFETVCGSVKRKQTYVCWECLGVLRKIEEFRTRAERAHQVLSGMRRLEESKLPVSLSTMTAMHLDNFSHDGRSQRKKGRKNIDIKGEGGVITSNQIFLEETTVSQANDEDVWDSDGYDEQMLEVTGDDGGGDNVDSDGETGLDSIREVDTFDKNKRKNSDVAKSKLRAAYHADTDDDSDDMRNSAKINKRKLKNTSEDEDDSSDSDTKVPQKKSRDEDSDYEPPKSKHVNETNENKRKNYIISYENNVKEVVRSVPIAPHEAEAWMDRERASEYFKKLRARCWLCASKVDHETLQQHMEALHTETLTSHTCSICKIVFASAERLREHTRLHYYVLECALCAYRCYSKRHMVGHCAARHRYRVQCTECEAKFGSMVDFKTHWQQQHKVFDCDSCHCQFKSRENLNKHIERSHTAHSCRICGKTYPKYSSYRQHMDFKHTIERGEDSFCVTCGVQFDNRAQYRQHLATAQAHAAERCDRPKPYPCTKCEQVFVSKNKLSYHYQKHHTNEQFICSDCGKILVTKSKLKQHIKSVHERVPLPRNKVCPHCGRGFTVRKVLIHHIRTHTGERPFKCPHCDAAFAQKVAMTSHIKSRHKDFKN